MTRKATAARRKPSASSAYASAGVDIDEMAAGLSAVKKMIARTHRSGVVSEQGSFGGMFTSPGKEQVLVASTDGVGTKLHVACLAGRHNTVGQDLVNHCVNDILVQGARPLFFLDYVGTAKLSARVFKEIVKGLCKACRENGCALLGGETAEMPGLYPAGEYDLVGTIVGAVDRQCVITGCEVRAGDTVIGLPSRGLHTNGYSLARKILFDTAGLTVRDPFPGTRVTVADTLLAVHRSYLNPVSALLASSVRVRGMAHITGGGLIDNLPRVLPEGTAAVIQRSAWRVPLLFRFLQEQGRVDEEEMYRVFNMGIGYTIVVREKDTKAAMKVLQAAKARPVVMGHIEKNSSGTPHVTLR